MAIRELLEDALDEPSIWTDGHPPTQPPFENALEEGLQVGLDLSREEREFHQVSRGLVLLFHS